MLIDGVIDELLESFELPIEGFDNPIDAGLEVLRHDLSTVFLHGAQRDELTAANDQVLDGLSVGVRGWTGNRLYRGGELSDETSIDRSASRVRAGEFSRSSWCARLGRTPGGGEPLPFAQLQLRACARFRFGRLRRWWWWRRSYVR